MFRELLLGLLVLPAARTATTEQSAAPLGEPVRYALVPPRNLSGAEEAPSKLVSRLESALEARGATFVPAPDIDRVLRERRVRYTDSLAAPDLAALAAATGATHTLLTTVFAYEATKTPRIAFSVRALDNLAGTRALSSVVVLNGADFEGLLGLGKIEDIGALADEALTRALEEFDDRGAPRTDSVGEPSSSRPSPPDGGYGFAREDFDATRVTRIVVLPFTNRSGVNEAPVQFAEFLADAWFHEAGVQVVEPADLRVALVRRKVRSMQFVDLQKLAEIGRGIGVRYFVLGAIERWGDDVLIDDQRFPQIEASVQLVDTEDARIVAAAAVERRGSDYQTVLGLGAIHEPIELAQRAAREIVAALGG